MAKPRTCGAAFKRPIAQAYLGGATLHGLPKAHDISRNRIRVDKCQAGDLDGDVVAADRLQSDEARTAAFERLVGRPALTLEFLKGLCVQHPGRETRPGPPWASPAASPSREGCRLMAGYALSRAADARRPAAGCVRHSDRGSHYAARAYRGELAAKGLKGSMGRRGNPCDDAKAESFVKTLKGGESQGSPDARHGGVANGGEKQLSKVVAGATFRMRPGSPISLQTAPPGRPRHPDPP